MKEFACKDVYPDCDFKVSGQTEDEVLKKAAEHGREKHGLQKLDPQTVDRVRSLIHDKKEVA